MSFIGLLINLTTTAFLG